MGTHGRNAITDKDGNHYCSEQSMDGYDACSDFMTSFLGLKGYPNYPTMGDQTNECNHGDNFAHIDYKHKIFYAGCEDPKELLDIKIEDWMEAWGYDFEDPKEIEKFNKNTVDYYKIYLETKKERIKEGWRFLFNVDKCPKEYGCINSVPATINDFLNNTIKYRLWDHIYCASVNHIYKSALIYIDNTLFKFVFYDKKDGQIYLKHGEITPYITEFFKRDDLTDKNILVFLKNFYGNSFI